MRQNELWHDTGEEAAAAGVAVAGGVKKVAGKLWPAMGAEQAAAKLRGCLSPGHLQKPDLDEIAMLIKLAREEGDDISLLIWLARHANCEVVRLSPEESKKKAKKARVSVLLAELARLSED